MVKCQLKYSIQIGHFMYHQFYIQTFQILPTQCICVFCTALKQTAIISLYSIN